MQEQDKVYLEKMLDGKIPPAVEKNYSKARALADKAGMHGPMNNQMLVMVVMTAKEGKEAPKKPATVSTMKPGDNVIVKFEGEDREGVFLHPASKTEKGKLRVAIVGDKKKFREVPEKDVKPA